MRVPCVSSNPEGIAFFKRLDLILSVHTSTLNFPWRCPLSSSFKASALRSTEVLPSQWASRSWREFQFLKQKELFLSLIELGGYLSGGIADLCQFADQQERLYQALSLCHVGPFPTAQAWRQLQGGSFTASQKLEIFETLIQFLRQQQAPTWGALLLSWGSFLSSGVSRPETLRTARLGGQLGALLQMRTEMAFLQSQKFSLGEWEAWCLERTPWIDQCLSEMGSSSDRRNLQKVLSSPEPKAWGRFLEISGFSQKSFQYVKKRSEELLLEIQRDFSLPLKSPGFRLAQRVLGLPLNDPKLS